MSSMQSQPSLGADIIKVLRVVTVEAADGYTLMERTGLNVDALAKALEELVRRHLVDVKGSVAPDSVGKAYVFVPPGLRGDAVHILRYFNL